MKSLFLALSLLFSLTAFAQDGLELERKLPWLGNAFIDVKSYDLDVMVPAADAKVLQAKVKIRLLANKFSPHVKLHTDSTRLRINKVALNNTDTSFEIIKGIPGSQSSHITGEVLKIKIPEQHRLERRIELDIEYDVNINDATRMEGFFTRSGVLTTRSWPYYSRMWIPSNDHPSDPASFSVRIFVPEGFDGISNGILLSASTFRSNQQNMRVFKWVHAKEMPTYAFSITIGKFEKVVKDICYNPREFSDNFSSCSFSGGRVPAVFYLFPGVNREAFLQSFDKSNHAMVWFSTMLGNFEFEKLGFITAPSPFSMEHNTIVVLTNPRSGVHEVIHHWFGNNIRIASWGDLWISEGFTTWLTGLYDEHKTGTDTSCRKTVGTLNPPDNIDPLTIFDDTPYCKGASTLNDLRERVAKLINEAPNSQIVKNVVYLTLRKIYQSYKFKQLSTPELLRHLRNELPRTLYELKVPVNPYVVQTELRAWAHQWIRGQ